MHIGYVNLNSIELLTEGKSFCYVYIYRLQWRLHQRQQKCSLVSYASNTATRMLQSLHYDTNKSGWYL
jgi:hypothetical protein